MSMHKITSNLTKEEYNRLYQIASSPEKFYGTVKQHKLKHGSSADDLPLRPVISNIETASHQLVKLLSQLSKSQYTVNKTKDFIDMIKNEIILSAYKMISFDVSSLFIMISLDCTIGLTLKRIYGDKEIKT